MKRLLGTFALFCLLLPRNSSAMVRPLPYSTQAVSFQSTSLQHQSDYTLVTVNVYAGAEACFCRNDPVNVTDPLGLHEFTYKYGGGDEDFSASSFVPSLVPKRAPSRPMCFISSAPKNGNGAGLRPHEWRDADKERTRERKALIAAEATGNQFALGSPVADESAKGVGQAVEFVVGGEIVEVGGKLFIKIGGKLFGATTKSGPTRLFHYTNEKGLAGITESEKLLPSLKSLNPNDVRYGNGQYLSDIGPGTKTPAQLSREFIGQPFQGAKYTHYLEIDVSGLNAVQGRPGVFVIPNEAPLDLTGRIIGSGKVVP